MDVEKPIFTKGKENKQVIGCCPCICMYLLAWWTIFLSFCPPVAEMKVDPARQTYTAQSFIPLAGHSRTFRTVLRRGNVYCDPLLESDGLRPTDHRHSGEFPFSIRPILRSKMGVHEVVPPSDDTLGTAWNSSLRESLRLTYTASVHTDAYV